MIQSRGRKPAGLSTLHDYISLALLLRLYRNHETDMAVILNGVKNLARLIGCKRRDRSAPQDDIEAQSLLEGEE
jgi:hypothetical protein